MRTPSRLPDLDLLRALAVLLVLGRHLLLIPPDLPPIVEPLLIIWRKGGWIGVDLFFTLSGFLVSGLMFSEYAKTGVVSPGRFLIRRGLKIYPAFYFFLLVATALSLMAGVYATSEAELLSYAFPAPTIKRIASEILFVQNYRSYIWCHTWSLAVEEHFYLFLAGLVAVSVKRFGNGAHPFKFIPFLVIATGIALLTTRILLGYGFGRDCWHIISLSHLRFDSLLFGVLLSYFYHFHHGRLVSFYTRHRKLIAFSSIGLILPAFILEAENRFMYTFGLSFLYLGFGNLIILFRTWESPTRDKLLLRTRYISEIGRHSYSLYLWHAPVYLWTVVFTRSYCHRDDLFAWEVLLYMGGSILLGVGASILVEQPVLHLRDRYFPSKSGRLK